MIMLQDDSFRPIEDEDRYYRISSNFWETTPDDSTGILQLETKITQVKLERCDLIIHFGKYRDYFAKVPFFEHHYCPVVEKNNITLYGSFGDINPYSYLETWVRRCDNTTRVNKRSKCFSTEVINRNLQKTYLSFKFLDYSIDHSNLVNPSAMYMRSEAIPINSNLYKRNWYLYRVVNYTTDAGLLLEDIVSEVFTQVSNLREQLNIISEGYESGSFSQVTVGLGKAIDTYNRQYTKAQQTLANVGGITKGLLLIAAFINYIIGQELYYMEIMKSIFTDNSINRKPGKRHVDLKDAFNSSDKDLKYLLFK